MLASTLLKRSSQISQTYDDLRFGGASGEWVNARELNIVKSLLPPRGRVLDLACGTGRLGLFLREQGYDVIGLDSSAEMLKVAIAKNRGQAIPWVQANAFELPLASGTFDAAVALRFAFHLADLRPLLGSLARVVVPGGSIIFDTYNWSPRAVTPVGEGTWGGRVYIHSRSAVEHTAKELALKVVKRPERFLFSPYLYRLLPLPITRGLGRLEAIVPGSLRARVFWQLQATGIGS